MRGVYSSSAPLSAVTAASTLLYITAPAAKVVEVLSISITQKNVNTNDQMYACLQKIGTLGTPTATANTPAKHESGDQAAGSTVKVQVTASEPTYTASTEVGQEGFSNLGGYYFDPTPEERPVIAPSDSWGVRLLDAPASSTDFIIRLTFREIG